MEKIREIQETLREYGLDGWLFYSFRGSDPYAGRILGFSEEGHFTRRWLYYVPALGEPVKIVHTIERGKLDMLPGEKYVYLSWQKLHESIRSALGPDRKIAMQYSPFNDIPYVACVDAGTVELIRSFGKEIVSSASLIQKFEALLSPQQREMHMEAAAILRRIVDETFAFAGERARSESPVSEYELQQFMLERFRENRLVTSSPPVAAVNEHSADPHYDPRKEGSSPVGKGDFLLIDLWGKLDRPKSVYGDITWTAFLGEEVPEKYANIFGIVSRARDSALELVEEYTAQGRPLAGSQVDDAARQVIGDAGYGDRFLHRTGHSIGEEVHGSGVQMDNLETKDSRLIVPGCCFSIEPGIYLEGDFGIRSEIDVVIDGTGAVCTGAPVQKRVVSIPVE